MIGFGQILVILLILVLLFGNLPKLLKDAAQGIKIFKKTLNDSEIEEKTKSSSIEDTNNSKKSK